MLSWFVTFSLCGWPPVVVLDSEGKSLELLFRLVFVSLERSRGFETRLDDFY